MHKLLSEREIRQIIDTGAIICKKIKSIRPDHNWYQIAALFTAVKRNARQYFPELDDLAFLRAIDRNFSFQDIEDALHGSPKRTNHHAKDTNANAARQTQGTVDTTREVAQTGSGTHQPSKSIHHQQVGSRV